MCMCMCNSPNRSFFEETDGFRVFLKHTFIRSVKKNDEKTVILYYALDVPDRSPDWRLCLPV